MDFPRYQPHPAHNQRLKSAKLAIRSLLPLDLYPAHKKELLSICIWKITEADGKSNLRYRTEAAILASKKECQHEHVHERKELIKRLLSGENVDLVLDDAIACTVTKSEHQRLSKSDLSGWSRYVDCNIRVYDALEQKWLIGKV